ncbi:putative membrane protein [Pseudonocardia sp. Ae168_Ps1]|uniref:VC0807 family protein n=1 Tax=unclassified Pseudonocardia TaxID=2619320 RepID=UPI00094B4422|nr:MULTISPECIES: VC0807 family protein [unclassified Pseudonocardia]OLL76411.1 putative membrane protein [Pseudonocardia sp. Ae150A_Ps1]OLL82421.1 putative membrane protein [Pseudonocardia sp. Ae168_Ps1]OLL83464.1 putative membrane protein [Pseudonocardia sp. Ae263_Ps1]OLL90496.1 putative membrane protein [Pseudonocardia sp. Ae356_Ps1]
MNRRELLATVGIDVVAPLAVFYGLRASGVGAGTALLAGAAAPAVRASYVLVRHRRVEWFAVLVLVLCVASAATSLVSGDERVLLARDGLVTAALGATLLVTVPTARPALFTIGRIALSRAGHDPDGWDRRWADSSRFRTIWRWLTAWWALGLFADAALRVVAAYALPVDVVPAVHAVQWFAVLAVLLVGGQVWLRLPRHRDLVFS